MRRHPRARAIAHTISTQSSRKRAAFARVTFALFVTLSLILAFKNFAVANESDHKAAVDKILTDFHTAASNADWDRYFSLLGKDAIFIGTDAGERWDIPTFKKYAQPSNGWTYNEKERHITLSPDGNTAWFDEILHNAKYGTSRGTGVLIRTQNGWKIMQYHLTFPIPNDLAQEFTSIIQLFDKK